MDPATGDYIFGRGQSDLWIDAPDGVAQHIYSRMMLWTGQWFADTTEGTAWAVGVLGERTQSTRDLVVIDRVRTTPHVVEILSYGANIYPDTREWRASMTVLTEYGPVLLRAGRLPGTIPPLPTQPLVVTPFTTRELGVTSGATPVSMVPADLLKGPTTNIANFTITGLDGGVY
jgi:hypothetical protein